MDRISEQRRSWNMSQIRNRDTRPERQVRSMLHQMGYRFRLQAKDLPGRPDVVLPKYRTVVLVHGCFWHRHEGCRFAYAPKSRVEFWRAKFRQNVRRDLEVCRLLEQDGWRVVTVWECELRTPDRLRERLNREIVPLRVAVD